jgi:hypothetical protein
MATKRNLHHRYLICAVLDWVERVGTTYGDAPNYNYLGVKFSKLEWEKTRKEIIEWNDEFEKKHSIPPAAKEKT